MKKLLLLITAMVAAITLTACSGAKTTKTKMDEIKEKGKIVLGVSPDYPPYEFTTTENGQKKVVGADIYLAQEIAKKLGVEVEIQEMAFDSLIAAVNANKVDMVISGVNPTEERKKAVDFSDIYYTGKGIFVVNKDSAEIKSVADLKGKKVGVQKGSTYENNDIKISTFSAENDPEATGMAIVFKKAKDGSNKTLLEQVNAVIKEIKEKNLFEKELDKYAKLAAASE